jgi:hypothetical protein
MRTDLFERKKESTALEKFVSFLLLFVDVVSISGIRSWGRMMADFVVAMCGFTFIMYYLRIYLNILGRSG